MLVRNPWIPISTAQLAHRHKPQQCQRAPLGQPPLSDCSWHLQIALNPMSWFYFEIWDQHTMKRNRMCISSATSYQNEQLRSFWSCGLWQGRGGIHASGALFTSPGGRITHPTLSLPQLLRHTSHTLSLYLFIFTQRTLCSLLSLDSCWRSTSKLLDTGGY